MKPRLILAALALILCLVALWPDPTPSAKELPAEQSTPTSTRRLKPLSFEQLPREVQQTSLARNAARRISAHETELPAFDAFHGWATRYLEAPTKEREKMLAEGLALAEELELDVRKPFGQLSFGNRKKVGLVVAELTLDPGKAEILFYDEPFTGLDTPARLAILARWRRTENEAIRIVSCHPDFDAMEMPKALLIADGKIFVAGDGTQTWADLKNQLT
jgi:ABC-type multidrug transport system ATPase subunit